MYQDEMVVFLYGEFDIPVEQCARIGSRKCKTLYMERLFRVRMLVPTRSPWKPVAVVIARISSAVERVPGSIPSQCSEPLRSVLKGMYTPEAAMYHTNEKVPELLEPMDDQSLLPRCYRKLPEEPIRHQARENRNRWSFRHARPAATT